MRIPVLALGAFPTLLLAQNTTLVTSNFGAENTIHGTWSSSGRTFMGVPVVNAPYSAQRVTERVQIGSDGTRFTQNTMHETLYRDSQGRVRTERPLMMGPNAPAGALMMIEIQDPIAGFSYTLDVQGKIAHRTAMQVTLPGRAGRGGGGGGAIPMGTMGVIGSSIAATPNAVRSGTISSGPIPAPAAHAGASTSPRPEVKQEDLGQQTIEGVQATGRRLTQTWPTGSQGNDRPFQVVTETWLSPELKEMLLSKTVDPRSGENTTRLTNISRSEPDAGLFMPPADYRIVDETGSFQINWTAPRP